MDATAWVAIAGIGATLAGSIAGPLVLERARRQSARLDHLRQSRLDCYTDLIRLTARLADNAMTWSAVPLADLKEAPDEELDLMLARVHAIGSGGVHALTTDFVRAAHEFNRRLFDARLKHARAGQTNEPETGATILSRMAAGEPADELRKLHGRIIEAVRTELT